MELINLIDELKRFISDRVTSSQAKESIKEFRDSAFLLSVVLQSSTRTFVSRISKSHEDGQTLVCELIGYDIEVAIMLFPKANEWVRALERGTKFKVLAKLISYDTLYNRAIFVQVIESEESKDQTLVKETPITHQESDSTNRHSLKSNRVKPRTSSTTHRGVGHKVSRRVTTKDSNVFRVSKARIGGKVRKKVKRQTKVKRFRPVEGSKILFPLKKQVNRTRRKVAYKPNPKRGRRIPVPPSLPNINSPMRPNNFLNTMKVIRILIKKKINGTHALTKQERLILHQLWNGRNSDLNNLIDATRVHRFLLCAISWLIMIFCVPFELFQISLFLFFAGGFLILPDILSLQDYRE